MSLLEINLKTDDMAVNSDKQNKSALPSISNPRASSNQTEKLVQDVAKL